MQKNPLDVDFKDGNRFFQKLEVKFKVAIDFLIIGSNFPLSSPKFVKKFSIYLSSNDCKEIHKKSSLNPVKRIYLLNSGSALQNYFVNKTLLIFSKKYVESGETR